ncbi:ATP-binding cassette domain-containing protein [Corynebacterium striatum]|uniref:ATP-binding cassette domain-containing protein n=1 Tax=Corynebacterium striatum TaxID=43770 RepID=UPI0036F60243|nr:ABC transporter ATP-binding protein [Corynebacterium striatum]
MNHPMLSVQDLCIRTGKETIVGPLSFSIEPGQRLGIIGESGSGKSLTALAIMGLLPKNLHAEGSIELGGRELVGLRDRQVRKLRGADMAMVFQEPMSALDPLMRVSKQLRYAGASAEALNEVGLDAALASRFPHELSGGQRQRVMIAMAMARNPKLLICDEPTTALDATTQDSILDLIMELTQRHNTALLFISHDLRVIRRMCPETLVMQDGQIVESGAALDNPQHPYTKHLIAASQSKPAATEPKLGEVVISLDHVTKAYGSTIALSDVSLEVRKGERIGVVGSSGSGKTTLLKLITGLEQPTSGSVQVEGRVQMVFQDPQGSLNPRMPIWKIVAEGSPTPVTRAEIAKVLAEVGIDEDALDRFPHEFSGGQRQRISIARAVIGNPDILLADEAVSALDVSVRAQVLELLERLVESYSLTLVFISHDLGVVKQVCSSLAVIYHGELVERGVWSAPQHPYTKSLLGAAQG